jgi:hypothetical protein
VIDNSPAVRSPHLHGQAASAIYRGPMPLPEQGNQSGLAAAPQSHNASRGSDQRIQAISRIHQIKNSSKESAPSWRKTASHCATTATTGEWATLICRVPVSAKPIMVMAPMNMQIAMNWPLRSLIT